MYPCHLRFHHTNFYQNSLHKPSYRLSEMQALTKLIAAAETVTANSVSRHISLQMIKIRGCASREETSLQV